MEFRADAAIYNVGQGSTIVHAHVNLVFESLDLGARQTLRHCLMCYVHWVVYSWKKLGCVAHGERVHFRAHANKIDDRITFGLVFEIAHFFGVEISITTSEARKMLISYLAEIESVLKVRAREYLCCQIFNEEVKKNESVSV